MLARKTNESSQFQRSACSANDFEHAGVVV